MRVFVRNQVDFSSGVRGLGSDRQGKLILILLIVRMESVPTAMVLIYPRLLLPRRRESRQVRLKSRAECSFALFCSSVF